MPPLMCSTATRQQTPSSSHLDSRFSSSPALNFARWWSLSLLPRYFSECNYYSPQGRCRVTSVGVHAMQQMLHFVHAL
uniref:Uncharacterized protein n=1 Tax=Solanum lycopersicum TaxID=4081 RepID=A0A3Q7J6C1_SOLLC